MSAVDKLREIAETARDPQSIDQIKLVGTVQQNFLELQRELDSVTIPYGRLAIYDNPNVTMQAHYHSPLYEGQIHDHGTWGMMVSLKGCFALEDWVVNTNRGSHCIRKYTMPETGMVRFPYLEGFDWHKNTNLENNRAISLHIYGPNYKNDYGTSYDPNSNELLTRPRLKMENLSDYGI